MSNYGLDQETRYSLIVEENQPRIVAKKSARTVFANSILYLEAFVILFAALAAHGLQVKNTGVIWSVALVLFVFFVAHARMLDKKWVYYSASALQGVLLVIAIYIPMMLLIALIFIVLWIVGLWLGNKIDRERKEYDQAHPETAPNV